MRKTRILRNAFAHVFILLVYFSLKATTADRQTEEGRKRERTGESREREKESYTETDRQTGKVIELSANSASKGKRQNLLMLSIQAKTKHRQATGPGTWEVGQIHPSAFLTPWTIRARSATMAASRDTR